MEAVAELVKLTPLLGRKPLELSGGQQQRTALARALAKNAKLVLLDEPLANLDYKLREELRAELPKIFEASGGIFVYATAEPEEALLLGGNTATLKEGRVTAFGPTVSVYRHPATLDTAATFSDPPLNTLDMVKAGAVFRHPTHGTEIPVPSAYSAAPDGPYTVAVRPHHLFLTPQGEASIPLVGTVGVTEITGSESFIHVTCSGSEWTILEHGIHDHPPGHTVNFHTEPRHLMVFHDDGQAVLAQTPAAAA